MVGGFDSTLEELYAYAAAAAVERGYNCLTFEGPGQGEVIYKKNLPFRYDWEKVATPISDFVISNQNEFNVNPKRIALMGISMGGYLLRGLPHLSHTYPLVFYIMEFMTAMMLFRQVFQRNC